MIDLDNLWIQLSQESKSTERKGILKRSILREVGLSVGYDTVDNKKILKRNLLTKPENLREI